MLKEAKGNMYGFITHTWNPIKGNYPIPLDIVMFIKWYYVG
jgi:hypothetical protein